jgi:uncharacterized membrane protein
MPPLLRLFLVYLLAGSLVYGKTESQNITLKSIDQTQTTLAVLELSFLTLLPILSMVTIETRPNFRNETYITASLLTIPVIFGWPLFFHELHKAQQNKIPLNEP